MTADLIVTTRHLFTIPGFSPRPGFCRGRSREFFQTHGLDWNAFVREGINAQVLIATGDALAKALVDWAQECHSKEMIDGR